MACRVVWTDRARQDLEDIIEYIAVTLASPQAAREHLTAFAEAADRISHNPKLYAISSQPSCAARNQRACFIKRYVLLYSYHDEDLVIVNRIFSTLRDYALLIAAAGSEE